MPLSWSAPSTCAIQVAPEPVTPEIQNNAHKLNIVSFRDNFLPVCRKMTATQVLQSSVPKSETFSAYQTRTQKSSSTDFRTVHYNKIIRFREM